MSLLINILMLIRSVCLSFRPSTVVRYYMKYTGLSLGPSPPISFLDILLIVRGASSQSLRERTEIVGIDAFLKKKEDSIKRWATFYLDLHYVHHAHYIFIRVINDLNSVLLRGRSAMLFHEPVSLVVIGLQKTWTISWNLATK